MNNRYIIFYDSIKDFTVACSDLMKEGACFEAYAENGTYKIILTGGY